MLGFPVLFFNPQKLHARRRRLTYWSMDGGTTHHSAARAGARHGVEVFARWGEEELLAGEGDRRPAMVGS
jgi:hypothetical protein